MAQTEGMGVASIVAVSRDGTHRFSKQGAAGIVLLAGLGVEGDAHSGVSVQHRSRVAADPTQPNLRQVHLLQAELLDELRDQGFQVEPGQLGENVTTSGVDLLALPRGALLRLGAEAVVEITGLRNPCVQINAFRPGLLSAVLHRDQDGTLIRRAGVMGIVLHGGQVWAGDPLEVWLPAPPHLPLDPV